MLVLILILLVPLPTSHSRIDTFSICIGKTDKGDTKSYTRYNEVMSSQQKALCARKLNYVSINIISSFTYLSSSD